MKVAGDEGGRLLEAGNINEGVGVNDKDRRVLEAVNEKDRRVSVVVHDYK